MASLNFNTNPYFDDYDEDKGFHRVLFKPGVSVQARELTQLQTILQKQVERFGRHFFKEGSIVIPGGLTVDTTVGYVTLAPTYNSVQVENYLNSFVGTIVTNANGVRASVVTVTPTLGTDPITLYVKYLDSGDNHVDTFDVSDVITSSAGVSIAGTVTGVGPSSIASLEEGVYFALNNFVKVQKQTIVLDKYSNTPSYRIGLLADERLVTSADDSSLLDNATGTPNFAAPGADRYQLNFVLAKLPKDSDQDQNFVELAQLQDGQGKLYVDTADYAWLADTLARRTYDESGSYTVRDFAIQPREHRKNFRGEWATGVAVLAGDLVRYNDVVYSVKNDITTTTNPTLDVNNYRRESFPVYNDGVYTAENGGNVNYLAIGIEPGKAYVYGYEVEKPATEYIPVEKSRDFVEVEDDIININTGNYILVENLDGVIDSTRFASVSLYDRLTASGNTASGSQVGTARVRYIEHHSGTPGTSTCQYKLGLFDIRMNSGKTFERNVKQIYGENTGAANVTVDVSPYLQTLTGAITASASTTVSGTGTRFTYEVVAGDYIQAGSTVFRVASVTNDTTLEAATSVTVSGSTFSRIETFLFEPNNAGLIFPMPFAPIRSTDSRAYTVLQRYDITSDGAGIGLITTASSRVGDTTPATSFNPALDAFDYVVVHKSTGAVTNPGITVTTSQITLTGLTPSQDYTVYVPAFKSSGQADVKVKTLVSGATKTFSGDDLTKSELSLGKADIYRVVSIVDESGGDMTGWFNVDNGQRSTHYGVGKLIRKANFGIPTSNITATFDYFTHGVGDHFTRESYAGLRLEDIPFYPGTDIRLSDVIDFRPRMADDGSGFTGTGASLTQVPFRTQSYQTDYSYYIGRIDKIALDYEGNLFTIRGIPSINPAVPSDKPLSMTLYTIGLNPYTFGSNDITLSKEDNRRYTMRDIGKLETRLRNVEYYTSLNLLEQDTKTLSITDEFGFERYKNGFAVDSFNAFGIGDPTHPEYLCSLDTNKGELRPPYNIDNIHNVVDSVNNVKITGGMATLDYTEEELFSQTLASRTVNLNPFAFTDFIGSLSIFPEDDEWIDNSKNNTINSSGGGRTRGQRNQPIRTSSFVLTASGEKKLVTPNPLKDAKVISSSLTSSSGTTGMQLYEYWGSSFDSVTVTDRPPTSDGFSTDSVNFNLDSGRKGSLYGEVTIVDNGGGFFDVTLNQSFNGDTSIQGSTAAFTLKAASSTTNRLTRTNTTQQRQETTIIPYTRSRPIRFIARGLKPNGQYHFFFDSVDVNPYIQTAIRVNLTSVSGKFDFTTNATNASKETARQLGDKKETTYAYEIGDVVRVGNATSGTPSGVVAFADGNSVWLINVKGSFSVGQQIRGSISNATGTIAQINAGVTGGPYYANESGDIIGVFVIPNTDTIAFTSGIKEFKVTSDPTNNDIDPITKNGVSRATAIYSVTQKIDKIQNSPATTTAKFVTSLLEAAKTSIRSRTPNAPVNRRSGYRDPVAQTFMVDLENGCFLTSLDVFFYSKDDTLPVTLEIRAVSNGYPSTTVIPFGRVVKSAADIVTSNDASAATTFTFESPVFLEDATEYAITLISDSENYDVWVSNVGDTAVGTDRRITEQPTLGVFFVSQNATAWEPVQSMDLKFKLNRAKFSVTEGSVVFKNSDLELFELPVNAIQVKQGETVARAFVPKNALIAGQTFTISGAEHSDTTLQADLNTTHSVVNALANHVVFNLANASPVTGLVGGSNIIATHNVAYDVIQPFVEEVNFPTTSTEYRLTMTSFNGGSVSNMEVLPKKNATMRETMAILSPENEGVNPSLLLTVYLNNGSDNLSPVIDLSRSSVVAVRNMLDCPPTIQSEARYNAPELDNETIATSDTISFSGSVMSSSNATVQAAFRDLRVGTIIEVQGSTSNNDEYIVKSIDIATGNVTVKETFDTEGAGANVSIVSKQFYVDEIAPFNSSALAKYVTKQLTFINPCTHFRMYLTAHASSNCGFDVYYKTDVDENKDFEDINWTLVESMTPLIRFSNPDQFNEVTYEKQDLPQFTSIAFKIVMRGVDTSNVPRFRDLRIIACA